jgi:predicted MFS family arabinose efflux permease
MDRTWRWIIAIAALIAILALLAFARGFPPGHGEPASPQPSTAFVEVVA